MKVKVVESVLKANDAVAAANRRRMDSAGVFSVNLMSAPGSGKTTLLQKTIPLLAPARADVVQINTGRGCHLSATQVAEGLDALDLDSLDYLFIENVGNMVCPAGFDLGEHARAALLSLPEGADKIAKYPTLHQSVQVVLLTKTDLAGALEFDAALVESDLARVNSAAPLIRCSPKTGDGLDRWVEWLKRRGR